MSDESAFLCEMQANPEVSTPRLVYADWLEEQGDPRGDTFFTHCKPGRV